MLWIELLNSEWRDWKGDGHLTDKLAEAEWRLKFAAHLGWGALQEPSEAQVERLFRVRAGIQAMARALQQDGVLSTDAIECLNDWMAAGEFRRQLTKQEDRLILTEETVHKNWDSLNAAFADSFARFATEGDPARIKYCDNPNCLWVFLDETRNRTKRYCDDKLCGNLMKVRRFRAKNKREPHEQN
ncbi:CGNR zinc finger domain-containing protein [Paenibacillus xanthanilyticus]|uniref:CGNR zinc finger domain-containing protein n=1 Tax=Paenibacillus xanthanilyticus TaxID=1783531 RepID=A0ABV8K6P3_9BACL